MELVAMGELELTYTRFGVARLLKRRASCTERWKVDSSVIACRESCG
jgi:hypothetical protein